MKLSIVIATFNRRQVLEELLDSLKLQTDRDFEVIVVVDGSSDGTQEMLRDYQKNSPFPLRWLDTGLTTTYGLARARNLGIREARGEAVVILDDDSFPIPEFVREHKRTVHLRTLTGGARISTDPTDSLEEKNRLYQETFGDSTPHPFVPVPKYKWVVENNTCMFKTDWLASGLFDESITEYGLIGQTFNRELIRRGYAYQFNPRASIVHHAEFKQHHLYKKVKVSFLKTILRNYLAKRFPSFFLFLKTLKQRIEYR